MPLSCSQVSCTGCPRTFSTWVGRALASALPSPHSQHLLQSLCLLPPRGIVSSSVSVSRDAVPGVNSTSFLFLPSFLASLLVSGRGVTLSCLFPLSPNPPLQGASGPSAAPQACLLEMLPVPSWRPALVGLCPLLFTHCSPMRTRDTLSCPSQSGRCLCPLGPRLMLLVP